MQAAPGAPSFRYLRLSSADPGVAALGLHHTEAPNTCTQAHYVAGNALCRRFSRLHNKSSLLLCACGCTACCLLWSLLPAAAAAPHSVAAAGTGAAWIVELVQAGRRTRGGRAISEVQPCCCMRMGRHARRFLTLAWVLHGTNVWHRSAALHHSVWVQARTSSLRTALTSASHCMAQPCGTELTISEWVVIGYAWLLKHSTPQN